MFDNAQNNQSSTQDPINGVPPVVPPTPPAEPAPMVLNEMGVVADNTQPVAPVAPTTPIEPVIPPTPEIPTVAPAMPPMMPTEEPANITPPMEAAPAAPMAPDMPLAFAGAPAMPNTAAPDLTQKAEEIIGKPPASKKPWIIGAVVALVLMVVGAGSWYGYTQYAGEQARIAAVGDNGGCSASKQSECGGCSNPNTKGETYKCVWRSASGECKPGAQQCTGGGVPDPGDLNKTDCTPANNGTWCESNDSNGTHYAFCIDNRIAKGCNAYAVEKGYVITYGANVKAGACSASNPGVATCNCGVDPEGLPISYCFDKTGDCNLKTGTTTSAGNLVDMGLCGLAGTYSADGKFVPKVLDTDKYTCTDTSCTTTDAACVVVRYTCKSTVGGASCTSNEEVLGATGGFDNSKCGVQQLDVMCNGSYVTSRTRITTCASTPASAPPSAPPTPTLSCTSITKNVADSAITVNGAVTFTCLGAVAPAGATNLTYQFRSKIGTAAYTTMTNVTSTTASLTPTQCGVQYQVECRACGTISGQSQCTATWTGATP